MTGKRNFWNSCPKKMDVFPTKVCPLGKATIDSRDGSEGCPWSINSEQDHFCFWKMIRRLSNEDGRFDPFYQHEIAQLLNVSETKLHFMLKEAMENLKNTDAFEMLTNLQKEEF